MEKKFKFVIIDNETAEVKTEFDTDCFIAGVNLETGTNTTIGIETDSTSLASVIHSVEKNIAKIKQEHPEVDLLVQLIRLRDNEVGEDDE